MAIAATYLSDSSFSVPGDLTAEFATGARVLADCGADGLRYGTAVGVSASGGATTVSLTLDAGTLTANLTGVRHGNDVPDSLCNHAAQHAPGGRDPLASATTEAPGMAELATDAEGVAGTDAARVVPVAVARQQFTSWMRDAVGEFPGVIPPAYNLFAPKLALPGATTFTRASTGWVLSQAPVVKSYAINAPRFSYDADGNLLGLRIEGAATRLNTIAAAPTAAENLTVTAQAYTLSFFGMGQIVLSGAHAATVVGTGALPARASYTFTPTAGTLTLTPSGDVQHLQLETGPFATSPILGEGSAVARAAEAVTVARSDIDFNTSEGSFFIDGITPPGATSGFQTFCNIDNGSTSERILVFFYSNTLSARIQSVAGGVQDLNMGLAAADTRIRVGLSWTQGAFVAVLNGGAAVTGTSGAIPTGLTTLRIGRGTATSTYLNSTIRHLAYFPRALTAKQLQAMTM